MRYLTIVGSLGPDGALALQPGYLTDRQEYALDDPESELVVELRGERDELLDRHGLPATLPCGDGGTPDERMVTGKVPFPDETRSIRFLLAGETIHEIEVARRPPVVRLRWRPPDVADGRQLVEWDVEQEGAGTHEAVVGYSHTDGRSWLPLAVGLHEPACTVDFDALPGGDACRIAVTVTDGVSTATATSDRFACPVKPCLAMILEPENATAVASGERLVLRGQGWWREEASPELDALAWSSSIDGALGTGAVLDAGPLSPGDHRIRLDAGRGRRAGRATVIVHVHTRTGSERR